MHSFAEHIYQNFLKTIQSWDSEVTHDLYALAFNIAFDNDDPRQFEVWLNCNTIQRWQDWIDVVSSSDEAKWNSVYWLEPEGFHACGRSALTPTSTYIPTYADRHGIALRDSFLKSLPPLDKNTDKERENLLKDSNYAAFHQYSDALVRSYVDICVEVAQQMQNNGDLVAVCGQPILIVFEIKNDFDNSYAREQTRTVNPAGLADEYLQFCN